MYIMFRPPGSASGQTDTDWVPLQVLNWGFAVRAILISGAWQVNSGHSASVGNWEIPAKSPEWLVTHVNSPTMVPI
jgi:hypothetical protein